MNKLSHICFAALTAALVSTTVSAETVTIGIRSEPSSIDPYFHNLGPNNAMLGQIFGRLVDWTPGMDQ
ncbi:MAG TPA: ABC transporter substrate-binding protein, partial [Gammaproteobacteria bacterium]|nr:ABC transporter substrate-binding protein [Gammaproteobacteria bacterium]